MENKVSEVLSNIRTSKEQDLIWALDWALNHDLFEYLDEYESMDLVYFPNAFQLFLERINILPIFPEKYIYSMISRILEYNLASYQTLVDFLIKKKWVAKHHLMLRPYLLINIDKNKIIELKKLFNLVDPYLMTIFFQIEIPFSDDVNYFGYRWAWYQLFYNYNKDIVTYIIAAKDCSTDALIDYISWLSYLEEYESFRNDYYHQVASDEKWIEDFHQLIVSLEPNRLRRRDEILNKLRS